MPFYTNFFWATFFILYDPLEFSTGAFPTPSGLEMVKTHHCALRHWGHTNISWEDPIAPGEGWLQGSTTYDNYEGPDVRWEIWQGKWVGETSHTRKIEILGNDCEIVVLQKCKFNSIKTLTPLSSKGILWPLARGWQSNDSPKFNGSWKWCIKKPGKVESPKGHSSTTWTNFKPIMTTWPSWVDNFWQFT